MQKKTASNAAREFQWTDRLTATEAGLIEATAEEVAALSQMHTKQIGERPCLTEREIIAKPTLLAPYSLRVVEIDSIEIGIMTIFEIQMILILTKVVDLDGRIQQVTMIESGGKEKVSERSSIVEEVTLGEALMSCHGATIDPLPEEEELIAMLRLTVQVVIGEQRYVVSPPFQNFHLKLENIGILPRFLHVLFASNKIPREQGER